MFTSPFAGQKTLMDGLTPSTPSVLSGQPDFTRPVRNPTWRETEYSYRPAESHWYQRLHGLYSGQPAFGDRSRTG